MRHAVPLGYDAAMGLLKQPVERKLSAMLGAEVTFDKLNFSLLGGSVEAQGITVAGDDPAVPFLTIRRVKAEISLGAAMKKQFVIKSLTIEKPVVTIGRSADGGLNLPRRFRPDDAPPTAHPLSDTDRRTSDTMSDGARNDRSEGGPGDDLGGSWKFEARKVLLVDGEVHFHDASGYRASLERVLGEIKEAGGGQEFTLIVESAGRRDRPADLGQIRMTGRADNVPDLSQWQRASVRATLEIADALQARLDLPSLKPLDAKAELSGSIDLQALPALLPSGIPALDRLTTRALGGRVNVNGRATYTALDGLRVPELTIRAVDLSLGAAIDSAG